mgnify:CR=1 FL=1
MILLSKVDSPGSDVDSYVESLKKLLELKLKSIGSLKDRLDKFSNYLREEEQLSAVFYTKK